MILGSVNSILDISKLPLGLYKAIRYIKETDFSKLEDGEYEIDGRKIYAKVFTLTSREKDEADAEYHEHYIDVQYWISGCELMGIKERERRPYKLKMESNDLFLLDEELCGEKFVKAEKGDYMILFPCDIHRPGVLCGKSQTYRKAVIKVSIETL